MYFTNKEWAQYFKEMYDDPAEERKSHWFEEEKVFEVNGLYIFTIKHGYDDPKYGEIEYGVQIWGDKERMDVSSCKYNEWETKKEAGNRNFLEAKYFCETKEQWAFMR